MTPLIAFLLTLLATLRLTRLAIDDKISKPFRDTLASRAATSSNTRHIVWSVLSQLFECPWCIGFWISGVSAAAELRIASPAPGVTLWWSYPALVLSLSWLVGMIHTAMYVLEDQ